MNKSNNKNGFTMLDHVSSDIVMPKLSTSAQLIYLRIYRQTLGWHKEWDSIPLSQFQKFTGIRHNTTIAKAIRELEDKHLIIVDREDYKTNKYKINLDKLESFNDIEVPY